ncbi:MAG: site-2 protease family protein [Candidatus Bathyarchaeota archaeon]|nr:site-2 protease family protein [Candidatus Bathyarchaeum tardum]WGM89059.1 MAG: site-2 protease family protein [Candidatus Bathyarchaeum tardum]WNZ28704.1 MAG: site-2 protease family protein [Candidatus Bathyarchaeota archaeon]
MCCAFSDNDFSDSIKFPTFEEIQNIVIPEFDIEDSYVEHGIPTFYIKYNQETKRAFLRLVNRLDSLKLIPILRKNNGRVILRVVAKPHVNPSRNIINVGLFFATIITLLISGYFLAGGDIAGAILFTIAIMVILGTHEMGHKLLADKHEVDATYPYFIPGIPFPYGIGTFGAVIRQKALPPNRDALFDIGFTGPITGFIIATIVTIIGIQLSTYGPLNPETPLLPVPLLFQIILMGFQPNGAGEAIMLHPVAFAGWVGMVVTMLNLVPSGMFDGGHVARSVMNDKTHKIISYMGIVLLALIGWWTMAVLALFLSSTKHPGPLDDVSEITTNRKIGAIVLVGVFILSIVPM